MEIKNRYEELSDKYNKLLNQHTEQQTAVQDVKSEIRILIDELKNLSEKNERLRIEKEQTEQRVRSITEEVTIDGDKQRLNYKRQMHGEQSTKASE